MKSFYRLAAQHAMLYQIHVFRSEAHARAYIAVNRLKNFKRPSDARGSCMPQVIDHAGEHDPRVSELEMTIECGEGDATPTTPTGLRIDGSTTTSVAVPITTNARQEQRTYTVGRIVKTLRTGQPIGLLNKQSVVPATVIRLGYNSVIVSIDNGSRRPRELVIDCSTTGTTNSLTAIVSAPAIV